MPGHSSTNRGIGSNRDPHLVKNNGEYVETDTSAKLSKSFDGFLGKPYKPKLRKVPDGTIEYQSSSISNVPGQSFFVPKGTLSTNNREDRLGKEMLKKGYKLFDFICKKEAQSEAILELAEYEELCGIVDDLYEFKNRKFYNELAMAISRLQMRIEAAENHERYVG